MSRILYHNAVVVNEGVERPGYVLTDGPFIAETGEASAEREALLLAGADGSVDCGGGLLMPGVIDTHVHFRDPGLTDKADMATESAAALAGGVTTFADMPNTRPATVTMADAEAKMERAAAVSKANYAFFIGATNDNLEEILRADYSRLAGVKLFLGSSTGNMLVDSERTLDTLFASAPAVIAVHAEDENVIRAARARLEGEYPEGIPVERHPDVRPREACVEATRHAISLAERHGARLHVCHISTAEELHLIAEAKARGVSVTAETCPQYLLFDRTDFMSLGARIKCNPAIKEPSDRIALVRELAAGGVIDTIATDHAPHLPAHKEGNALTAASGMPMVQFSLPAILDLMDSDPDAGALTPSRVVELMCHAPARIFGMEKRGFIRPGYYADLTLVERVPLPGHRISDPEVVSRCGWTPLAGRALGWRVRFTVVNGGCGPMPVAFTGCRSGGISQNQK